MRHTIFIVRLLLAGLLLSLIAPLPAAAQTRERCFPETGQCVRGRLLEYWEQNGGLPVFGFPITPQRQEPIAGQTLEVQWFERNRLELHPENARPYDVLLGRLGSDLTGQGVTPAPVREAPRPGCAFFQATGLNVCGDFLAFYRAHGLRLDRQATVSAAESLGLFGLPISPEQTLVLSDGRSYTVQWFERARFERHPENPAASRVLLGRLGVEVAGEPAPAGAVDAIEKAVRDHIGPTLFGAAYTVTHVCTDRDHAVAAAEALDETVEDAWMSLRQGADGRWSVTSFGPFAQLLSAQFRRELGLPADFACLDAPTLP